MTEYSTIKELVIEARIDEGAFPSYEKLTSLVLKNFPNSKWKKTHYAWYKSKTKRGEIPVPGFEDSQSIDADRSNENEDDVLESIDASISLEKDLHSYLAARVEEIESGLALVEGGIEFETEAGRIDILAADRDGTPVVVELKAGKAKDSAFGQLVGYIGCIGEKPENQGKVVRGILVASDFDPRVVFAA